MIDLKNTKSVSIWSNEVSDQVTLTKIITHLGYTPVICLSQDDAVKTTSFVIFAREELASAWIQRNYIYNFKRKIKEGALAFVVIDSGKGLSFPEGVTKIDLGSIDRKEIESIIVMQGGKTERASRREQALKVKLNRLFYIYSELLAHGQVSVDDVVSKTGMSARTISRDIKTIKEICIDKVIRKDVGNDLYFMSKR
jgi:hypothetical protein